MENAISKKAWESFGESNCFLCGKSETGGRLTMYCRTEHHFLMESWNWKSVCIDCCPVIEKIENQVLD